MDKKKCKHCAMMIPKEAKTCPFCRKNQGISAAAGFVVIVMFSIVLIIAISQATHTTTAITDTKNATNQQIYREFEICMNSAKSTIDDNKLKGRETAVVCMSQLDTKYGRTRAKKAVSTYFD